MTRLPIEDRNVVDRPDLPEYELNKACPVTGEVTGLENHHIWRRSFGTKSWWVELPDGTVVGNRVNLSPKAHYRVTVNKARIAYDKGLFWWVEGEEWYMLRWQPPHWGGVEANNEELAQLVEPGHDCPTCKRRVPIPKKKTSPKTRVFSTRVPVDDVETFEELIDAAAEYQGIKEKPHHKYWILLYGLVLAMQAPKGSVPSG